MKVYKEPGVGGTMYGLQKGSQLKEAFVKTADKNVVDRWRAYQDEIYLDKLGVKIAGLQQQIEEMPQHIEYPTGASDEVKRAIDLWNTRAYDTTDLEQEKARLEDLKADCLNAESAPIGP